MKDNIRNFLESNQSGAALLRDHERMVAFDKTMPVDLRLIHAGQWDEFLDRDVTIPAEVRAFLAGHDGKPMETETVHALEMAVERFHGVQPPFHITTSPELQSSGVAPGAMCQRLRRFSQDSHWERPTNDNDRRARTHAAHGLVAKSTS